MCGIVLSNFLSLEEVSDKLSIILHRGPDGHRVETINNFTVGHCRLAIQGRSSSYDQPFTKNGLTIAYNGELWNNSVNSLSQELGITEEGISDTELFLLGFEKYGPAIFQQVDGVFGVAIISGDTVFVARDYIGEIPIYYYWEDQKLLVASELKVFAGLPLSKVQLLLPGHYLKINSTLEVVKYYSLPMTEVSDSKEEIISKFRDYVVQGVQKRIPKEVDYTVLLSGGIDSTIIAACLKQVNANLEAFTIHLDVNKDKKVKNNDLYFARLAAQHLGIKLHEVIITEEQVLYYLEETIRVIEDKSWTQVSSGLPHLLLGKAIKNTNFKVVFSGSGSDEIFGSYPAQKRWQWQDNQYDKARKNLVLNVHKNNTIRENKCLMASSLEIRSPFLDQKFLEYAVNIPIQYRFDNKKMKPMLRYAFQDLLTPELAWREKICEGDGVGIENIIKAKKDEIKRIYDKIFI
jgi:asparagine synthase (glutamine-hydrolysing)